MTGWADVASGVGQLAAGAEFGDVAGALAQNAVLSAVPLYGIMSGAMAAIALVRTWTGNEPRVSVLGAVLVADDPAWAKAHNVTELVAEKLVENAAVQLWHGNATFKGRGTTVLQHPGYPEDAWRWAEDFADSLAAAVKSGGPDAVVAKLTTSAKAAQAFDAARLLYAWARASKMKGWALPSLLNPLVATRFQTDGVAVLGKDPMPPKAEGKVVTGVHGTGGLFSRIGVRKPADYAEALAAMKTPSSTPIAEVFPGASAVEIKPVNSFEDQVASPGGKAAGAAAPASSLVASVKAAAAQPSVLPVAIGVGALAVALALL